MYSAFNNLKHEVMSNFINIKTNKDLKFSDLVDFHSKNKYLYFCYNINIKNKLGKLVSNSEDKNINEIFDDLTY